MKQNLLSMAMLGAALMFAGCSENAAPVSQRVIEGGDDGLPAVLSSIEGAESVAMPDPEMAVIKTVHGEMKVEFWPDVAPNTVANFKKLAKKGFYDNTAFHRVIKEFMIQGGDPNTKNPALESKYGQGGPGYYIKAEFNDRRHVRGVLSMARSGDPDSAGSQFFICHGDAASLNGKYTAFGRLIDGDDVLEQIATTPTVYPPGGGSNKSWPVDRMSVESIRIVPRGGVDAAASEKTDSPEKTNNEASADQGKPAESEPKQP